MRRVDVPDQRPTSTIETHRADAARRDDQPVGRPDSSCSPCNSGGNSASVANSMMPTMKMKNCR